MFLCNLVYNLRNQTVEVFLNSLSLAKNPSCVNLPRTTERMAFEKWYGVYSTLYAIKDFDTKL